MLFQTDDASVSASCTITRLRLAFICVFLDEVEQIVFSGRSVSFVFRHIAEELDNFPAFDEQRLSCNLLVLYYGLLVDFRNQI